MCTINNNLFRLVIVYFLIVFLTIIAIPAAIASTNVELVLPPLEVSRSNINIFSTPIAYHNGSVYTVNVEPASGVDVGVNLRTVVRKGVMENNKWVWESNVVENETIADPYHTQASIVVDNDGFIHIAYNMHNMPWQYIVSEKPENINKFVFRGQKITLSEKVAVKVFNKTPFGSIGTANIPGNQITYPAFFQDRLGDIYITYRYALRPKRAWLERNFVAGIAKYDIRSRKWESIGGGVTVNHEDADFNNNMESVTLLAFAYTKGWWAYLPKIAFDTNNDLHVIWTWRQGNAGADVMYPSYAFSPDNGKNFFTLSNKKYTLPVEVEAADPVGGDRNIEKYSALTNFVLDEGNNLYIVLDPMEGPRVLAKYDRAEKKWLTFEKMPHEATVLLFDSYGNQWAFSTGLKVYVRKINSQENWKLVYMDKSEKNYCYPNVKTLVEEEAFLVHLQRCDSSDVKILKIKWALLN